MFAHLLVEQRLRLWAALAALPFLGLIGTGSLLAATGHDGWGVPLLALGMFPPMLALSQYARLVAGGDT